MRWQALVFWPQAHLRQIGWVVIGGMALLMVAFLLTPNVDPIYPAELSSSPGASGSAVVSQVEHDDFVTRPLFLAVRRPTAPVVIAEAMPEPASQVQEMPFDGVGLLGVFASGGVEGAIVKLDDGTRLRVYLGESVNGWELTETGLRSAVFVAPSGATSRLELAVVSTLPTLASVPSPSRPNEPDVSQSAVSTQTPEAPSKGNAGLVTFGSIAESKAREEEARQKKPDEESTDG